MSRNSPKTVLLLPGTGSLWNTVGSCTGCCCCVRCDGIVLESCMV